MSLKETQRTVKRNSSDWWFFLDSVMAVRDVDGTAAAGEKS